MNPLDLIKASAHITSAETSRSQPPKVVASVITAKSRVLKAVTIENARKLRISSEAIFKTAGNAEHIVATAEKLGRSLSLASNEETSDPRAEVLPL